MHSRSSHPCLHCWQLHGLQAYHAHHNQLLLLVLTKCVRKPYLNRNVYLSPAASSTTSSIPPGLSILGKYCSAMACKSDDGCQVRSATISQNAFAHKPGAVCSLLPGACIHTVYAIAAKLLVLVKHSSLWEFQASVLQPIVATAEEELLSRPPWRVQVHSNSYKMFCNIPWAPPLCQMH